MTDVVLNPYVLISEKAEEAVNFYKDVFGGEAEISRFSDVPPMPGMELKDEDKNKVMHAVVKFDGQQLMISDPSPSGGAQEGNNVAVSLSGDDEAKLTKYFEGLSEGGKITQPLTKAAWGDTFGMLTDKYGLGWMVNITGPKQD